jgi:hypothetical protein
MTCNPELCSGLAQIKKSAIRGRPDFARAYVAASSPAFLNHCQGAPKRSGYLGLRKTEESFAEGFLC